MKTLPGGPLPGEVVGTPIYEDGEVDSEGHRGAEGSDEFFQNVAVDPISGDAWVSFYSTRLDKDRRAINVYVRPLRVKDDALTVGTLRRVLKAIDVSEGDEWGFYYGHYAGLAVSQGWPFPVWIGKSGDKEVFTYLPVRS